MQVAQLRHDLGGQGNSKASIGHEGCARMNLAIGDFWSALREILAGVAPTLAVLGLVFE